MLCGELLDKAATIKLLNTAHAHGINHWDTAEMYPVPQRASTQGASERLLGEWLSTRKREQHEVTTKVAGPGAMGWLRGGPEHLDAANITAAIDGSLVRLKTDYIDTVLLHWPDRYAASSAACTLLFDCYSLQRGTLASTHSHTAGKRCHPCCACLTKPGSTCAHLPNVSAVAQLS